VTQGGFASDVPVSFALAPGTRHAGVPATFQLIRGARHGELGVHPEETMGAALDWAWENAGR
jgi:hypothetical protein